MWADPYVPETDIAAKVFSDIIQDSGGCPDCRTAEKLDEGGFCWKTVRYSDREKMIVEEGLAAVERVLTGDDTDAIERLLLCLDYYMDPYYGNRLPYERELIVLLQNLILSSNPWT